MDYSEYGGAPLLGVNGVCIICHGKSNQKAIFNAVRVAGQFVQSDTNRLIQEELQQHHADAAYPLSPKEVIGRIEDALPRRNGSRSLHRGTVTCVVGFVACLE